MVVMTTTIMMKQIFYDEGKKGHDILSHIFVKLFVAPVPHLRCLNIHFLKSEKVYSICDLSHLDYVLTFIYVDMYVDNVDIYICFPPHGNWNSGREMSSPSNAAPPNPIIVGCSYSLYSGKNVDLDSYPKTH